MIDRSKPDEGLTYAQAGVDIDAGERAVDLIKGAVESTRIPGVLGSVGGFGALFELPLGLENPVLVSATDGVGTKILVAQELGRLDTVGIDLVAMSVNDVLTLGARPLFFLDYVAVGRLVPEEMAALVAGVAEGCRRSGCALVGGEMAEMPGLYSAQEFDLAGFCVGVAEKSAIIDGSRVEVGDQVIGLASDGFHSNGYSLVRRVLAEAGVGLGNEFGGSGDTVAGGGEPGRATFGEMLLRPTRIYVKPVLELLELGLPVRAMAHITGGGIGGNLGRVIPEGMKARLHFESWKVPREFRVIQELGEVAEMEMFSTFNMGVGFVLVVAQEAAEHVAKLLEQAGERPLALGRIARGERPVELEGVF
jgi:phosphoribosylformylglycinamidine cyclo-ligase